MPTSDQVDCTSKSTSEMNRHQTSVGDGERNGLVDAPSGAKDSIVPSAEHVDTPWNTVDGAEMRAHRYPRCIPGARNELSGLPIEQRTVPLKSPTLALSLQSPTFFDFAQRPEVQLRYAQRHAQTEELDAYEPDLMDIDWETEPSRTTPSSGSDWPTRSLGSNIPEENRHEVNDRYTTRYKEAYPISGFGEMNQDTSFQGACFARSGTRESMPDEDFFDEIIDQDHI
jgi:hypothetical protein